MARSHFDAWGVRRTDHREEIRTMRYRAIDPATLGDDRLCLNMAADLLQMHDETGICLDEWTHAKLFVEHFSGSPVLPNGI